MTSRGHGATVKGRIVAIGKHSVVGDDDAHRGIELPEAPKHPILPPFLIVPGNAHGAEKLLGDAHLAIAMNPLKGLPYAGSRE